MANYNKIIYGKKVDKTTIIYILARFLKENNCYHLWMHNTKHCHSSTFTWERFYKTIDDGHFSELVMQAPFEWHEVNFPFGGDMHYSEESFFQNKYGYWNLYQFWTKISEKWRNLFLG